MKSLIKVTTAFVRLVSEGRLVKKTIDDISESTEKMNFSNEDQLKLYNALIEAQTKISGQFADQNEYLQNLIKRRDELIKKINEENLINEQEIELEIKSINAKERELAIINELIERLGPYFEKRQQIADAANEALKEQFEIE